MHYKPEDFSKNGQMVLTLVQGNSQNVGQRVKFSEIDKIEVQKFYGCKTGGTKGIKKRRRGNECTTPNN
jgi:hypothetical protein